jgi:hypothetical protein
MSVLSHQATQHHIPEDYNLQVIFDLTSTKANKLHKEKTTSTGSEACGKKL